MTSETVLSTAHVAESAAEMPAEALGAASALAEGHEAAQNYETVGATSAVNVDEKAAADELESMECASKSSTEIANISADGSEDVQGSDEASGNKTSASGWPSPLSTPISDTVSGSSHLWVTYGSGIWVWHKHTHTTYSIHL